MIKVKALRTVYFNNKRFRPGEVFEVENQSQVSKTGMEVIGSKKVESPKAKTSAKKKATKKTEAVEIEESEEKSDDSDLSQDVI